MSLLLLALALSSGQYGGPYISPRLPLGRAAALGAFRPGAPTVIRPPAPGPQTYVPPVRAEPSVIYVVVVPDIRVRPSEVIIEPPEVHFIATVPTEATPEPPSAPATDTDPK